MLAWRTAFITGLLACLASTARSWNTCDKYPSFNVCIAMEIGAYDETELQTVNDFFTAVLRDISPPPVDGEYKLEGYARIVLYDPSGKGAYDYSTDTYKDIAEIVSIITTPATVVGAAGTEAERTLFYSEINTKCASLFSEPDFKVLGYPFWQTACPRRLRGLNSSGCDRQARRLTNGSTDCCSHDLQFYIDHTVNNIVDFNHDGVWDLCE